MILDIFGQNIYQDRFRGFFAESQEWLIQVLHYMNKIEQLWIRYLQYLDGKGPQFNAAVGLICTIAIGAFDVYAPDEATHSILYFLPIAFVTWFSGIRYGYIIMLICIVFWSVNNIANSPLITSWNIFSTLIFFSSIVILLHKTRGLWENEKLLSRTDPLTGAKNLRAFTELVEYEMLRSEREELPFSLAYLDLDNFKQVNDSCGHNSGDELLKSIVANIVINLRKTDVVGRLGGDEFAIFFPETDQSSVKVVMQKLNSELSGLMQSNACPATLSTGVVTCRGGVYDFEKLISYADSLMYDVKRSGKNNICYAAYTAETGMGV
jgi:diguanylate cyclase (GGDEF)-like protein